jgi:hypothetical protein
MVNWVVWQTGAEGGKDAAGEVAMGEEEGFLNGLTEILLSTRLNLWCHATPAQEYNYTASTGAKAREREGGWMRGACL